MLAAVDPAASRCAAAAVEMKKECGDSFAAIAQVRSKKPYTRAYELRFKP